MYICLSTGISATATGHLWGVYENLSRNSRFGHSQTKMLGAMPEARNVFQIVGSYICSTTVERMHCCVPMTACNVYYIFTANCMLAIQREHTVAFPWQQWLHECARMYIASLCFISFPNILWHFLPHKILFCHQISGLTHTFANHHMPPWYICIYWFLLVFYVDLVFHIDGCCVYKL